MGGYAVDPEQLQSVDTLLSDCAAHSRVALDGLRASAHALLGARWKGPAAVDFRRGWDEWHAAAGEMLAALAEMGQAVGASGRAYSATDADVQTAAARPPA